MRSMAFDLERALPAAWDAQWKKNLESRAKMTPRSYGYSDTFHLTATDVENQVRQFAVEEAHGEKWGSSGPAHGRPESYGLRGRFRIVVDGQRGGLQGAVRDWLLRQVRRGVLTAHNFGRGHVSGMRFRPAGEPLTDAETQTVRRNERSRSTPRPRHAPAKPNSDLPLCTAGRKRAPYRGPTRGVLVMHRAGDVTCPRCLKLMGGQRHDA